MNGCAKYFCVPSSLSSKVRVEQRNPKQEEHWSSTGTRNLSGRHMKDVQPWFWEQQYTHRPIQGMLKHWRVDGSTWHLGWTQPISSFPSTKFQILPKALSIFCGRHRFSQYITNFIQSKKLDGDIRTSVRHPTWSLILSMGRNQEDVFIKWSREERKIESSSRPTLTTNNNK